MKNKGNFVVGLFLALITLETVWCDTVKMWWEKPQVVWQPFTALPHLNNDNYSCHWEIHERTTDGTPKMFAHFIKSTLEDGRLFVSDEVSTTPNFVDKGEFNATSTAVVRWNNTFDEYFVGSSRGIYKYDEATGEFVVVWPWSWYPDKTYIVPLGNALAGRVTSWGSASGLHIWESDGTDTYTRIGGGSIVWADPVTRNIGTEAYTVRMLSEAQSLIIERSSANTYSTDGAVTFQGPVGTKTNGSPLFIRDFQPYSDNMIIINHIEDDKNKLLIGELGGVFRSLSAPVDTIRTLFYSRTTGLLVVGDIKLDKLYYTVLPSPEDPLMPLLRIRSSGPREIILSWDVGYAPVKIQQSRDLIGEWSNVEVTQTTVGDEIQATVSRDWMESFFRLKAL